MKGTTMTRILLSEQELDNKITSFLKRKNQDMHDRILHAKNDRNWENIHFSSPTDR